MCYLVVIGVAGYRGDVIEVFNRTRELVARPATNPMAAELPGARYSITNGHCACGIFGSAGEPEAFDAEYARRRVRRKIRDAARVERKVEALRLVHEQRRERELQEPTKEMPLVAAIRELTNAGARVSLWAHMFSGSFDEPFVIEGDTELPLQHFIRTNGDMPVDRVVTLVT